MTSETVKELLQIQEVPKFMGINLLKRLGF